MIRVTGLAVALTRGRPQVRPKKKPPNATQNKICTVAAGLGLSAD
jgi:hypothetical protein